MSRVAAVRARLKQALYRLPWVYPLLLVAAKALSIRRGAWTEPELDLVPLVLRPGETAVDGGANYGLWSYHLARTVGSHGRVVAFEPIDVTVLALRRVLRVLGVSDRVDVRAVGLSDRSGEVRFRVPEADGVPVAGLVYMEGQESSDFIEVTAQVCRLDDLALPGDVALLKLDLEGAEIFALQGAERLLRQHEPVIICEVGARLAQQRYGVAASALGEFLSSLGYQMPMRYSAGRLESASLESGHDGNYVFATPRRLDRLSAALAR